MNATVELAGERLVDQPVTFEPRLPFEGLRHNMDTKMRFSAWPMTCVPPVLIGFIDDA